MTSSLSSLLLLLLHLVCLILVSSNRPPLPTSFTVSSSHERDKKQFVVEWKHHLAGGLAGGLANFLIYPIDTVKTMMQTNPKLRSAGAAIAHLQGHGLIKLYAGFLPAVVGAIPSSALYFGSYELAKKVLREDVNMTNRHLAHTLAAACGNIASSFVFVPKEAIKQQLQAYRTGSLLLTRETSLNAWGVSQQILRQQGVWGFYPSYFATLARNIPSAAIRFTLYEELKLRLERELDPKWRGPAVAVAGAVASSIASGVTTPFDVLKTRLATGLLSPGSRLLPSLVSIARTEGVGALYRGMQARMVWAALYGGIGLTTYEFSKKLLGIGERSQVVVPLRNAA